MNHRAHVYALRPFLFTFLLFRFGSGSQNDLEDLIAHEFPPRFTAKGNHVGNGGDNYWPGGMVEPGIKNEEITLAPSMLEKRGWEQNPYMWGKRYAATTWGKRTPRQSGSENPAAAVGDTHDWHKRIREYYGGPGSEGGVGGTGAENSNGAGVFLNAWGKRGWWGGANPNARIGAWGKRPFKAATWGKRGQGRKRDVTSGSNQWTKTGAASSLSSWGKRKRSAEWAEDEKAEPRAPTLAVPATEPIEASHKCSSNGATERSKKDPEILDDSEAKRDLLQD